MQEHLIRIEKGIMDQRLLVWIGRHSGDCNEHGDEGEMVPTLCIVTRNQGQEHHKEVVIDLDGHISWARTGSKDVSSKGQKRSGTMHHFPRAMRANTKWLSTYQSWTWPKIFPRDVGKVGGTFSDQSGWLLRRGKRRKVIPIAVSLLMMELYMI